MSNGNAKLPGAITDPVISVTERAVEFTQKHAPARLQKLVTHDIPEAGAKLSPIFDNRNYDPYAKAERTADREAGQ